MSIGKDFEEKLEKEGRDAAQVPFLVEVDDGEVKVSARVRDLDRLGCTLDGLEVKADSDGGVGKGARELEGKLRYLSEDIKALEIAGDDSAILRSARPRVTGGSVDYFEIEMKKGGSARMSRVKFEKGEKARAAAPFTVTKETLERLVDDLTDAVKGG